jgi:hypothetical protein
VWGSTLNLDFDGSLSLNGYFQTSYESAASSPSDYENTFYQAAPNANQTNPGAIYTSNNIAGNPNGLTNRPYVGGKTSWDGDGSNRIVTNTQFNIISSSTDSNFQMSYFNDTQGKNFAKEGIDYYRGYVEANDMSDKVGVGLDYLNEMYNLIV